MMTNDVNGKVMFQFAKILSKLDEVKALFEEKAMLSSSKCGKSKTMNISTTKESCKSLSPQRHQSPSVQSPAKSLLRQTTLPRRQPSPQRPKEGDVISSDHSTDSPATRQRKNDWRAATLADEIWQALEVDTTFDESLITHR